MTVDITDVTPSFTYVLSLNIRAAVSGLRDFSFILHDSNIFFSPVGVVMRLHLG